MLVIRQVQMTALGDRPRRRFADGLVQHFSALYPREAAEAGGEPQIRRLVERGMQRAAQRGYTGRKEVGLFIALMFILGDGFDTDPQLPWVQRQLNDTNIPIELRPECVFDTAIDYLEETAGEESGFIVRALLRLQSYALDSAPESSGEAWIEDCCDRLESYYPEKFAYQGIASTRATAVLARQRAAQHGMRSNSSLLLYSLLMFMLGSGFDEDLLYPWAADALAAPGDDHERATSLHRAAMKHLSNSLTSDRQWAQKT